MEGITLHTNDTDHIESPMNEIWVCTLESCVDAHTNLIQMIVRKRDTSRRRMK